MKHENQTSVFLMKLPAFVYTYKSFKIHKEGLKTFQNKNMDSSEKSRMQMALERSSSWMFLHSQIKET